MQARLFRMEAIGAHMADAADLNEGEFDFSELPAQGGPVLGGQTALQYDDLAAELDRLSSAIKRREFELDILDDVLVNEEIQTTSIVQGRPVKWGWLSSKFGQRVDPITGKTAWHSGVDFAGRDGSDVIAVASGVVTFAGKRSGYGKLVEISHANGYVTRYGHHKEITVAPGDVVKKGEPIGQMGSSGRSTGPHVHFEVLKNGRTVDPASYVSRRS
jgi:murein DD-endopeptidase MepM/ murein hydrolase activator NlpD